MANQMIALGVRGPQLPDLGAAAARYGAMANTLLQQRAAERQSAQSQQAMEIARNQEQRAASQHEIEQAGRQIEYYTVRAGQTMNRAGYEQFLGQLDRDAPEIAAQFRTNLPPENFNRDDLLRMVGSISDNFSRTFAPLNTEVVQGTDGKFRIIRRGGFEPAGAYEVPEFDLAPADTGGGVGTPAAGTPAVGTPATENGLNARPGEMPRQMVGRGIRAENVPTGSPLVRPMEETAPGLTPASAGGGMGGVQPFTMETAPQIIQNAVQNRVIDQTHMQQLREMVGPENERSLAAWMQQNQIRIQPTGEAPIQPGMRSAEYRPDMAPAPQFQQVQTAPSGMTYRPTGRAATGRPPLTSPSQDPGTAGAVAAATREPVGVSVAREAGTTRAQRQAEVETEGPITTSRARAERLERLRGEAPKARGDVDAVLSHTSRRVNAIDRLLDSRAYESIVGPIEGRIPTALMTPGRANAQRLLDTITNTDVLQDIISARGQTETGGSPLGNVSNSDLQLYIRAANELEQAGDENEFREALLRLRRELIGNTARTRRTYTDTFRELGGEMQGLELTAPPPPGTYVPGATRRATRPAANRPAARGRERTHSSGVRILGL
jgi:hypothetical protein